MIDQTTIEERVQRGIEYNDAIEGPEWVHRIDVSTLNLNHVEHCVLGQLHGGKSSDGFLGRLHRMGERNAVERGFCFPLSAGLYGFTYNYYDHSYAQLTAEWKRRISALQEERRDLADAAQHG